MNKRRRYKAKRKRLLRKQAFNKLSLFFDLNLLPTDLDVSRILVWDKQESNVQD